MKTRQELLAAAGDSIDVGQSTYWVNEPQVAQCAFLHAIACVMLAKEMREGKFRDPGDPRMVWDKSKNAWVYDEEANA